LPDHGHSAAAIRVTLGDPGAQFVVEPSVVVFLFFFFLVFFSFSSPTPPD
jgi:hypothetical protein